MKPEEYKLLIETATKLDQISKKLDVFFDLYYRTNMIDRTVFGNPVYFNNKIYFKDGTNIATGGTNGLKIGTATTNKIGFFNATPVDQPATVSDPSGGATVDSQARTAISSVIDRLQELGLIA